jgi:hypothetical protein
VKVIEELAMDEKLPPPIHSGDGVWTQKIPNSSLALSDAGSASYRPIPERVWEVIENPPKLTSDRPFVQDSRTEK